MRLAYLCPSCRHPNSATVSDGARELACTQCAWTRDATPGEACDAPRRCLVCGCDDLWRQKDFPQRVGLAMVGLGILLSTIAWSYYRPVLAIGVLMGFALIDLLLFAFMRDVLVCYRCHARHGAAAIDAEHPRFDLETAERYRQEEIRLQDALRKT